MIVYRLTVEKYHAMLAGGILEEGAPFELVDGQIVRKDRSAAGEDPMTIGTAHATCVYRLTRLDPKLVRAGCFIRTQQPLTLPPFDEPEPDGAIVGGQAEAYAARHPGANDVLCVIEVADSSLHYDRTTKMRAYADSGIPQYVIINLPDGVIEVYTQPLVGRGRYGQTVTLAGREAVTLPTAAGKGVSVPVR